MTERISKGFLASTLIALSLTIAGCINITTRLPPEDISVKAVVEAQDCAPIIFSLAYGTISVENALAGEVTKVGDYSASIEGKKITRIRRVELHDWQFLFFGERCIRVIGE